MENQVNISIVEGDPIYSNLVEARLQKLGYTVISKFTSGEEVIKKLGKALPHMLMVAINIPGKSDGIQTAMEILSRYNVPSVFLTTSADDETLERVKNVPGAGYVLKPFSDNDLRIAIGLCLSNFEFVRQIREENARLRLLVEEIPAGIIVTDARGLITYVNETATAMLKWKNPLLKTNIFNEIVTIVDSREGKPIEDPYAKIMAMKAVWWLPQNASLISMDQTKMPVAGNFTPLCNHDGSVSGMIAILFPVAEINYLHYRGKAQF
jgi:CheY-like chemotaxis protein